MGLISEARVWLMDVVTGYWGPAAGDGGFLATVSRLYDAGGPAFRRAICDSAGRQAVGIYDSGGNSLSSTGASLNVEPGTRIQSGSIVRIHTGSIGVTAGAAPGTFCEPFDLEGPYHAIYLTTPERLDGITWEIYSRESAGGSSYQWSETIGVGAVLAGTYYIPFLGAQYALWGETGLQETRHEPALARSCRIGLWESAGANPNVSFEVVTLRKSES